MKIGLVTSRGGHLFQLYELRDWWKNYERFWVTGRGGDSQYLLKEEKVYFGFFPENRQVVNTCRNFLLALKIISREKPDLLVSLGAGIAPPFFLAGKILGCRLLFIDSYSFVKYPSLSAKLCSFLADKTLVQHPQVGKKLPRGEYLGSII